MLFTRLKGVPVGYWQRRPTPSAYGRHTGCLTLEARGGGRESQFRILRVSAPPC